MVKKHTSETKEGEESNETKLTEQDGTYYCFKTSVLNTCLESSEEVVNDERDKEGGKMYKNTEDNPRAPEEEGENTRRTINGTSRKK
ncbi:hypothetical protein ACJMK2_043831, partial [Sinanodonta woodiana]